MRKICKNISVEYIPMTCQKTTSVGVYIHRPLNSAEASLNAVLPYVLQSGCRLCPTMDLVTKYLEELYGASMSAGVMKKGCDQLICVNGKSISNKYAPEKEDLTGGLIELMLSVIFEPVLENGVLRKEFVDIEKKNSRDKVLSLINNKQSYALHRCSQELYGDSDIALYKWGSVEGIDKITPESLYEHYKNIISSSVIDIYVCGDTDIDAVCERIQRFIENLSFNEGTIPKTDVFKSTRTEPKTVSESMDVTQGKLSIGFTTEIEPDSKEYWGLMVANSIFGGGAHSKLFNNVREKLSLAYYASSGIDKCSGVIFVNAGIEFENYDKALEEIKQQLKELQDGKISDEEFNAAILAIVNALNSYYDDQFNMQLFYLSQRSAGVDCTIESMKEEILKVTVEDVVRAAKKIKLDTIYFLKGVENA